MSGNNEVKEFICSLGYDYQLGDSALIEGEENINTFLGCIFEKNRIGMDMICGDCSGDVINFKKIMIMAIYHFTLRIIKLSINANLLLCS